MKRGNLSQGTRFNVFRRDGFRCRYCGRSSPEVVLHCDHVIPRAKGGPDTEDNLVTSCADCNHGKSTKNAGTVPFSPAREGTLEGLFGLELQISDVEPTLKVPEYQFRVLRHLGGERYLVQLYEFWFGQPTNVEAREGLLDSGRFRLFTSADQWRDASDTMTQREAVIFRTRLQNEH